MKEEVFKSAPYCLNDEAARLYGEAIEVPTRRRRKNIHTDHDAAQRAGFRAPIAGGEHTYALIAELLLQKFGDNFQRGGRLEVSFVRPVHFGDTVTCCARIVSHGRSGIELEVWAENGEGEKVAAGTARVAGEKSAR